MGLDQYFYRRKKKIQKEEDKSIEIAYFRKHHDLHNYMKKIYISRGGQGEFNRIPLFLNKKDIQKLLEYSIDEINRYKNGKEIKHTNNFIYGYSTIEKWEDTLEVCKNILINTNFETESIFYDSWW